MSKTVRFTVPGIPVAKGRPKFASSGKFVRAYTPKKTVNYEVFVKSEAAMAMAGNAPFDGPVAVHMVITVPVPSSWSQRRKDAALCGAIAATKKPDADNVKKAVLDGMNGVVFLDDAQVVEWSGKKQYGDTPGVFVDVRETGAMRAP